MMAARGSTTPGLLQCIALLWDHFRVREHDSYGHLEREALEELEAAHIYTYRTDLLGASRFYLDGKHVTTDPWNQIPAP
jgi:competence protein ComEC